MERFIVISCDTFKAWAQISLFIVEPYLQEDEKSVWLGLSKVRVWYRSVKVQVYNNSNANGILQPVQT